MHLAAITLVALGVFTYGGWELRRIGGPLLDLLWTAAIIAVLLGYPPAYCAFNRCALGVGFELYVMTPLYVAPGFAVVSWPVFAIVGAVLRWYRRRNAYPGDFPTDPDTFPWRRFISYAAVKTFASGIIVAAAMYLIPYPD